MLTFLYRLFIALRWPMYIILSIWMTWWATFLTWEMYILFALWAVSGASLFIPDKISDAYKHIHRFIQWLFIDPFRRR